MISIICGQDFGASREMLVQLKNNSKTGEKITLSAKNIEPASFLQEISGNSLFGGEKLVIIEDFFSQKKISFDVFSQASDTIEIILWESSDLPKGLRLTNNIKVYEFKPKTVVFKYLDSLIPGNRKAAFLYLRQAEKQNVEDSVIFFLLIKNLRLLLAAKSSKNSVFFENEHTPFWMQEKAVRTAACFDVLRLKKVYRQLFEADWKSKTGQTENLKMAIFWSTYQLTAPYKKR